MLLASPPLSVVVPFAEFLVDGDGNIVVVVVGSADGLAVVTRERGERKTNFVKEIHLPSHERLQQPANFFGLTLC